MTQTLKLEGVHFSYPRRKSRLFTELNLILGDTGPTVLLGLNGAGKTTLLRLCAGELQPSAGSIAVDGGKDPRSVVSLMPQQIRPIPGFRVVEQVAYSAWLGGCSSSQSEKRAIMALEAVQLEDRMKDKPNQLSGGQLRRVGLAQALVGEQPIVYSMSQLLASTQRRSTYSGICSRSSELLVTLWCPLTTLPTLTQCTTGS